MGTGLSPSSLLMYLERQWSMPKCLEAPATLVKDMNKIPGLCLVQAGQMAAMAIWVMNLQMEDSLTFLSFFLPPSLTASFPPFLSPPVFQRNRINLL